MVAFIYILFIYIQKKNNYRSSLFISDKTGRDSSLYLKSINHEMTKNVVKAKFRMSSGKALHIQQRIIHIHTGHNSKKGLLPVCPGQRPSASSKPGPPERGQRQGFPGQLGDRQGQGKTMSAPSHARALAALRPQPSGSAREIVPQPSPWRGERTGNKCVTPPGQSSP